jgi:uncharacterized protein YbcI
MDISKLTMPEEIAQSASALEYRRTGNMRKWVTVFLNGDTLIITLHGALSPVEQTLARGPEGAAQVQELHQQLFTSSADSMTQELKRITGAEVREVTVEIETISGTVVHAFTTDTMAEQVFLLARGALAQGLTGSGPRPGRGEGVRPPSERQPARQENARPRPVLV